MDLPSLDGVSDAQLLRDIRMTYPDPEKFFDTAHYATDEATILRWMRMRSWYSRPFFQTYAITLVDIHDIAAYISGESWVRPGVIQRVDSYTMLVGDENPKAIWFRSAANPFDLRRLDYARKIYGRFVPGCKYLGSLRGLNVYEMDCVPGVAFCIALRHLHRPANHYLLVQTVKDFVALLASSWNTRPSAAPQMRDSDLSQGNCVRQLARLAEGLPTRFHPRLDEVRKRIGVLFTPDYPQVLNTSFLEQNVNVDLHTGRITGVVDWPNLRVGPFGLSLVSLEMFLIQQTTTGGWAFLPRHAELREIFSNSFFAAVGSLTDDQREAIKVGRVLGLFLSYGFTSGAPTSEGHIRLSMLEGFLSV